MKKKILSLLSIFLLMVLTVNNVYAIEITKADNIVNDEGTYDSLRLVAGNKVTSKATIDGISFIAGNDLYFEGNSTYGMYAGNLITVNGNIEKDLLVAGNKIIISEDATIGRDVYLAGSQIEVKANLARDLRAGGDTIDLSGITIGGDAYIGADRVILDENTIINGTLTYYDEATIIGLEKATIGNVVTKKIDKVIVEYDLKERIYAFFVSTVAAFITMLCLLYFVPKTKEKLEKLDLSFGNIAKTACIGFLVLAVIPLISLFAMFTGFLTPLAIIVLAIYFISIYLASLFVCYIVGNAISKKLLKKDDMYIALLIGILIVKLAKIIPIVGGYIHAVVLFYGLGIIYDFIKNSKK